MAPTDKKTENDPLPGSEGLRPFSFQGANKFELQTANDLFDAYAADKDPRTLGKINALKLDMMKRAANAEIAKLEPKRTRADIEREMSENQVSKEQANDELAYVLVTYLQNVEKLENKRESEKASATAQTKAEVSNLKKEVSAKPEETGKPKSAPEKRELNDDERKSAKFISENRSEIDALITKLPEGKAKSTFPGLLNEPTKGNVIIIQAEIGLKGDGPNGTDGRFGKNTLTALRNYVERGGKKPEESPRPKSAPTKAAEGKPTEKKAEKKPTKAEIEAQKKAEEAENAQKRAEAEEAEMKSAAEKTRKSKEVADLQAATLANLKPIGNDVYVVNTKFTKDWFAGAAFFKFDAKNGEWLWNAFNNPDHSPSSKWHKVSKLESATVDGTTKLEGPFQINASTQETVNAILAAQGKAREYGIPLRSPNAPSPIAQMIPQ